MLAYMKVRFNSLISAVLKMLNSMFTYLLAY